MDKLEVLLLEICDKAHSRSTRLLKLLIQEVFKGENYIQEFEKLLTLLEQNRSYNEALASYLLSVFDQKNYLPLFTEVGISESDPFTQQIKKAIFEKILPESHNRHDVVAIVKEIFTEKHHLERLINSPNHLLSQLFYLLNFKEIYQQEIRSNVLNDVLEAIQVLSIRLSSLGFTPSILKKLPELEKYNSPFMAQAREISIFLDKYHSEDIDRSSQRTDYKQIKILLDQCEDYIELIRKRKNIYGVSLKTTSYLIRIQQFINRLNILLYLVTTHEDEFSFNKEIILIKNLSASFLEQNNVSKILRDHLELISFQIVEYTGQAGENYITKGLKDYFKMFVSAAGGGYIVGFLTLIKAIVYYMGLAPLGTAFLYSMNYSFGFMLIHITHSKLATKQPAMTASALANNLDMILNAKAGQAIKIERSIVEFIFQLFRSQFIAFIGNVVIALPVAFLATYILLHWFDYIVIKEDKAWAFIQEIHPTQSLSLFHASIAGVYLFFAGVITGYYDNKAINLKLSDRIKNQKLLQWLLPKKKLISLSTYLHQNLGQLAGNFYLGIFLGITSTVGAIVGLPLDIRHITFSAGNFGIALATLGLEAVSHDMIMTTLLGIALIGFFNFVVSFSLSFIVAVKARKLKFDRSQRVIRKTIFAILKRPWLLFFPVVNMKSFED
jgi:site-specific recombinase